ncbi:MAG: nucleoside-triphosphatase [Dehalococcoidales bacterium]|nr:nucleoside-triphosphatase [Dehalococcoidales bacterium]
METAFLVTGLPGSGKTSLIKQALTASSERAGGFYTEEIRSEGARLGFRLVTLDGRSTLLAHIDIRSRFRVSRYGVDIEGFDEVGVKALQDALFSSQLVVIDEIGRMELFSETFKKTVAEIIDNGVRVLGTVMYKSDPWADAIKSSSHVRLFTLTRQNRPEALQAIQSWMREKPD